MLEVLDLNDEAIRSSLGLTVGDLTGDDYAKSQDVAEAAREAGFGGILAPSAAMPGRATLVVFATGLPSVTFGRSRARQPSSSPGRPPAFGPAPWRRTRGRPRPSRKCGPVRGGLGPARPAQSPKALSGWRPLAVGNRLKLEG